MSKNKGNHKNHEAKASPQTEPQVKPLKVIRKRPGALPYTFYVNWEAEAPIAFTVKPPTLSLDLKKQ